MDSDYGMDFDHGCDKHLVSLSNRYYDNVSLLSLSHGKCLSRLQTSCRA
jgi:hypothetical protein